MCSAQVRCADVKENIKVFFSNVGSLGVKGPQLDSMDINPEERIPEVLPSIVQPQNHEEIRKIVDGKTIVKREENSLWGVG